MNEPSIPRDQPLRGIVLMLAALAFFSCSDAASKLMTATLPAAEVAWLRFCVFTLLILGAARMTDRSVLFSPIDRSSISQAAHIALMCPMPTVP